MGVPARRRVLAPCAGVALRENRENESDLWARLWALPIAVWWHEQRIEPTIVATYVRLATMKPEHASCLKLMTELGLTPASMLRLRLVVDEPQEEERPVQDPYRHLRVAE